jgi:hypothetical protein
MLPICIASVASAQPKLESWKSQYLSSGQYESLYIPRSILIFNGWKKRFQPTLAFEDSKNFSLGAVHSITQWQANWASMVNTPPSIKPKPAKSEQSHMAETLAINSADIGLLVTESKLWRVYSRSGGQTKLVSSTQGGRELAPKSIGILLKKIFGYDAVVLDSKGSFVLVASLFNEFEKKSIQALAFANSDRRLNVNKASDAGAGLMNLVDFKGAFGVFKIVFIDEDIKVLSPGTKLLFEELR